MHFRAWDLVFLAGFVAYVVIRGVWIERTKGEVKEVRRSDPLERVAMALVFLGSLLLPALHLFTPLLRFADYALPAPLPWCGAALLPLALWLFWRAHADLGTNWSATLDLRRGHELVTHGVYRRVRHPMYAAIFLFSLAQALLLGNGVAGPSAFVTFAVLYAVRVPREEALMIERFGPEYRAYQERTGRLLPRRSAPG